MSKRVSQGQAELRRLEADHKQLGWKIDDLRKSLDKDVADKSFAEKQLDQANRELKDLQSKIVASKARS